MNSDLLTALAGIILVARINACQADIGKPYLLPTIATVYMGGTSATGGQGGVIGTVIGALIMTVVENGMNLLGVPSFVLGYRKNDMELLLLQCDGAEPFSMKKTVIDAGGGPSQIEVLPQADQVVILAENRQFGAGMREIALYALYE